MKRKIYFILFVAFLVVAGISAYQLISDQVEYRESTAYYESFADSWVRQNPAASEPQSNSAEAGALAEAGTRPEEGLPMQTAPAAETGAPMETGSPAGSAVPEEQELPEESDGSPEVPGNTELPEMHSASFVTAGPAAKEPSGTPVDTVVPPFTTDQPPITVDFDELHRINPDIVGWIYCENSPINYPVLQGKDNEKYLKVRPDGKASLNGSVFIDCKCERDFSSDNTLMFSHNRKTGMFACLPRFKNTAYYSGHSVMWLLTPDCSYKVNIFAGFNAYAESWVYDINFFKDDFRTEYVDRCLSSSDFKPAAVPADGSRLLTLSTCYYFGSPDGRYVLIGELIPVLKKD